jgi:hypothetical protein
MATLIDDQGNEYQEKTIILKSGIELTDEMIAKWVAEIESDDFDLTGAVGRPWTATLIDDP